MPSSKILRQEDMPKTLHNLHAFSSANEVYSRKALSNWIDDELGGAARLKIMLAKTASLMLAFYLVFLTVSEEGKKVHLFFLEERWTLLLTLFCCIVALGWFGWIRPRKKFSKLKSSSRSAVLQPKFLSLVEEYGALDRNSKDYYYNSRRLQERYELALLALPSRHNAAIEDLKG